MMMKSVKKPMMMRRVVQTIPTASLARKERSHLAKRR